MTNCPNCGAPINSNSYKCEYCGTTYDNSDQQILRYEGWLNYEYEQLKQKADMEKLMHQLKNDMFMEKLRYQLKNDMFQYEQFESVKQKNKLFEHLKALWTWPTK